MKRSFLTGIPLLIGFGLIAMLAFAVDRPITPTTDGGGDLGSSGSQWHWVYNSNITVGAGQILLKEKAAAGADSAAYGQPWIKSSVPNTPWFTDDAGNDGQFLVADNVLIATHASDSMPTINDNTCTDMEWATETSDADSIFASNKNIQFTRTGLALVTVSYEWDVNANSTVHIRFMADSAQQFFMGEISTDDTEDEAFFSSFLLDVNSTSVVYHFEAKINTSDSSNDLPTGENTHLRIILFVGM